MNGLSTDFFSEIAYLLVVLGLFILFSIFKGRQAIMNVIIALYLALLISIEFPNYEQIFSTIESSKSLSAAKLIFFAFITLFTTALTYRIMPSEFRENRFESVFKKILLAVGATILVMTFSFHVLPVTDFLASGSPLQSLFAPVTYFFWWLLVPLVILYIV